jgi:dynein light chain LC8-type
MSQDPNFGKVNIAYTELNEADQTLVTEIATNALKSLEKSEKTVHYKDIAQLVKHDLDNQKGGTWNVVVGRSYGSYVTHETKTMSQFFVGNVAFLVWRHG